MNLVLNVEFNKKLKNGDILVYQDGKFINLPKNEYLDVLIRENNQLKREMQLLKNDIEEFKNKVNDKLKEYHNILQLLTKEN